MCLTAPTCAARNTIVCEMHGLRRLTCITSHLGALGHFLRASVARQQRSMRGMRSGLVAGLASRCRVWTRARAGSRTPSNAQPEYKIQIRGPDEPDDGPARLHLPARMSPTIIQACMTRCKCVARFERLEIPVRACKCARRGPLSTSHARGRHRRAWIVQETWRHNCFTSLSKPLPRLLMQTGDHGAGEEESVGKMNGTDNILGLLRAL